MMAYLPAVICCCGWLATEMPNWNYYCENPLCVNKLKVFRVALRIEALRVEVLS